MRTKCLILASLLICLLGGNSVYAQQPTKIIINQFEWDEDNTVPADTTHIWLRAQVYCTDENNVNIASFGNTRYWVQTDSMDNIFIPPFLNDWNPNPVFIPIAGKWDTLSIPLDSMLLRTGPVNVIIIWPSLVDPGVLLVDSGFDQLQLYTVGLPWYEEPGQKFGSTVFPNPSMGTQIVFLNSKYHKEIDKITMLNSLGQVMNTKQFGESESSKGYIVPTEELPPGMYHLQIIYRDNKTEVVKFIKN